MKETVETISACSSHSLFIDAERNAWSCGSNDHGQLGISANDRSNKFKPTKINHLPNIKSVSSSYSYSLFLDTNGEVWSCGFNHTGQLGLGDKISRFTPEKIKNIPKIQYISVGGAHSLLLDVNESTWACGYNGNGQLGIGNNVNTSVPIQILNLPTIKSISAGYYYSLLLDNEGNVWAFGKNDYGQIGNQLPTSNIPIVIENIPIIVQISAGDSHSVLLDITGSVWSFGRNESGQLGHGDSQTKSLPTKIQMLPTIKKISAGGNHTLLLDNDNRVWAFGCNEYGELGLGDLENRSYPIRHTTLPPIAIIKSGYNHSLISDKNGSIWACGHNQNGQLGIGDYVNRKYFVKIEQPTLLPLVDYLQEKVNWKSICEDLKQQSKTLIPTLQKQALPDLETIKALIVNGEIPLIGWTDQWNKIHQNYELSLKKLKEEQLSLKMHEENILKYRKLLEESEEIYKNLRKSLSNLEEQIDTLDFYDTYLKPLSEAEEILKTPFLDKIDNPESFTLDDVSLFLNASDLLEFIAPFRSLSIDGPAIIDIECSDLFFHFGIREICKVKQFQYAMILLKNKLFLKPDVLKQCPICRNPTTSHLVTILKEYEIKLDYKLIAEKKLTAPQFIFLTRIDVLKLFPPLQVEERDEIFPKIKFLRNIFTAFVESTKLD